MAIVFSFNVLEWNEHGGAFAAPASWRHVNGRDYLVLRTRGFRKHLGPRSPETERHEKEYSANRERVIAAQVQSTGLDFRFAWSFQYKSLHFAKGVDITADEPASRKA
jgi:hypothetical protein